MNIQSAIKSGKPFKTPQMRDYLYTKMDSLTNNDFFYWLSDDRRCDIFPVTAIMSEEWTTMEVPNNLLAFPVKPNPPLKPKGVS
jgi:hypothetical protein